MVESTWSHIKTHIALNHNGSNLGHKGIETMIRWANRWILSIGYWIGTRRGALWSRGRDTTEEVYYMITYTLTGSSLYRKTGSSDWHEIWHSNYLRSFQWPYRSTFSAFEPNRKQAPTGKMASNCFLSKYGNMHIFGKPHVETTRKKLLFNSAWKDFFVAVLRLWITEIRKFGTIFRPKNIIFQALMQN
jgi:hypothetical protein